MWTRIEDGFLEILMYALAALGGAWELSSEARDNSRAHKE